MFIGFNASAEAKKALDAILRNRDFTDASEAISTALISYEALCEAHSNGGQSAIDALTKKTGGAVPAAYDANSISVILPTVAPPKSKTHLPHAFVLTNDTLDGIHTAPTPVSLARNKTLAPKSWLFGQYNKLLPVKATCRALLNLLNENPEGIPLEKAAGQIARDAWDLGDFLYVLDTRQQRSRDEAFAAAFPVTASNGAQSELRFANQFVGTIRKGQLEGLPAALHLIVCDTSKESRLSLTQAGADFAVLKNPIFDTDRDAATHRFSDAEVGFLLEHVRTSVPEEVSAYKSVLDAISSGANSPDAVDKYLRDRFKLPTEADMAKTFLTTQRTGAISRLVDLDLVKREKQGLRVTYLVTPAGKLFQTNINKPLSE